MMCRRVERNKSAKHSMCQAPWESRRIAERPDRWPAGKLGSSKTLCLASQVVVALYPLSLLEGQIPPLSSKKIV